ncbi:hypothetical protein CRUP_030254 [Coryphaenoides rupestris]|nr:hypothetical protein CRUP_030254 [Coryphaenoides rupestris]
MKTSTTTHTVLMHPHPSLCTLSLTTPTLPTLHSPSTPTLLPMDSTPSPLPSTHTHSRNSPLITINNNTHSPHPDTHSSTHNHSTHSSTHNHTHSTHNIRNSTHNIHNSTRSNTPSSILHLYSTHVSHSPTHSTRMALPHNSILITSTLTALLHRGLTLITRHTLSMHPHTPSTHDTQRRITAGGPLADRPMPATAPPRTRGRLTGVDG